jgi:hypothetical protein
MGEIEETQPAELPNGPARVVTDNKKERFRLEYGGETVVQASVKVLRDEAEFSFRDAGVRLFVVSKFDGWDVVTQTIRVAAVGAKPGDRIAVRGHALDSGTGIATEIVNDQAGASCIYSPAQDWIVSVEDGPSVALVCEDVPVKGAPETTVQRISFTAEGPEVILRFRPYYRQRHVGGA